MGERVVPVEKGESYLSSDYSSELVNIQTFISKYILGHTDEDDQDRNSKLVSLISI
jgi:hypothetical protein